jgi:hypothetical protein
MAKVADGTYEAGVMVRVSGNNIILSPPLILTSADVTKMAEGISAGLSAASQGARTGDGALEQRAIGAVPVEAVGERRRRHGLVGAEDPHEIGRERDLARGWLPLPVMRTQIEQGSFLGRDVGRRRAAGRLLYQQR